MMIRYPGSKAKLSGKIIERSFPPELYLELWDTHIPCYCEPFFGSGAIGWEIFSCLSPKRRKTTTVVINDVDPGIAALWKSIRDVPLELIARISSFEPSADDFYKFKDEDGDMALDPVVLGFQKLALHQMSFSGLGYMSGGPLGGKAQTSAYSPDCRWNSVSIEKKIQLCHKIMKSFLRFDISCGDFAPVLEKLPAGAFAYLDPPYYVQGSALYRHSMTESDHERLAEQLKQASFNWTLSYDDHPKIRDLYSWARIASFDMTPTVQTSRSSKRRKNKEIVISKLQPPLSTGTV